MTKLRFWFYSQTPGDRKRFIKEMVNGSGLSRKTIYNCLDREPQKLTKDLIIKLTSQIIPIDELYKSQKP